MVPWVFASTLAALGTPGAVSQWWKVTRSWRPALSPVLGTLAGSGAKEGATTEVFGHGLLNPPGVAPMASFTGGSGRALYVVLSSGDWNGVPAPLQGSTGSERPSFAGGAASFCRGVRYAGGGATKSVVVKGHGLEW